MPSQWSKFSSENEPEMFFIKIRARSLKCWMPSTCRVPSPRGPAVRRAQRGAPGTSHIRSFLAPSRGQPGPRPAQQNALPSLQVQTNSDQSLHLISALFSHSFLTGTVSQSDVQIQEPSCRHSAAEDHQKISALYGNLTDSEGKWICCKEKKKFKKAATGLILLPEKHGKASSK